MKKFLPLFCALLFSYSFASSQEMELLFDSEEILEVSMKFSIKKLRTETNDSTLMDSFLIFKNPDGSSDTLDVGLRVRGNFRRENCFYPPLRMRLKKQEGKGNLFDGSRNLKIVFPCATNKNADSFIVKEYLCYQLYEEVSQYTFKTRMIRINFQNEDNKKGETEQLLGFLIEDDDKVAERFDAEVLENKKVAGTFLEDSAAVRHDLFQYMIGNTDWSSLYQHNMKILKLDSKTAVPLAYDFDMTGMVMPPYAQVSNLVDIENVSERLYRGYCRDEELMKAISAEFLGKEQVLFAEIQQLAHLVPEQEVKNMTNYLAGFFDILKNERLFEFSILTACRTTE
ncbi:hypothetical protein SAMN04489724_4534 [Algoriphagus locisalis]|uniref:Uncharacterized protein n=1 Tax=Algoriphagus locisalis TaxID=305507 RepID=A0A1I7DX66_9BACT|nr:hypothetical protein [Algoriphagus locisalis]SFU16290.1 hypothetical protein SAMN04489724_4534 [Algoriphagus locisalis]